MDPSSAIAGALIAGALAASKDLGGQVLKDAYAGLKKVLADGYDCLASDLLDKNTENEDFKKAVESELAGKPEAVADAEVRALADELLKILESQKEADVAKAGIDVTRIKAGRDVIATATSIRGEEIEGGRDVVLTAQAATSAPQGKA